MNLLLEEWDQQRSVKRKSAYANFEVDRKSEFLANLAYALTMSARGSPYSKDDLISAYEKIHGNFGLPIGDAAKVANELESHTASLRSIGYEEFEFSHKSLQEYLAAEFIVRLPTIPSARRALLRLPNELAIATAISSQSSQYFSYLVLGRFDQLDPSFDFIRTFVTRLLLESPDFEKSSVVGVALIALYSRYLQLVQKNPAQLSLFILDQLRSEFSALGEMIRERVSEGELLQVYEVSGRAPSIDVDPAPDSGFITVLTRRKRTGGLEADRGLRSSLYRLPKTIWIRQSVLSAEKRPSAT